MGLAISWLRYFCFSSLLARYRSSNKPLELAAAEFFSRCVVLLLAEGAQPHRSADKCVSWIEKPLRR